MRVNMSSWSARIATIALMVAILAGGAKVSVAQDIVRATGNNAYGQLGNNTVVSTKKYVPSFDVSGNLVSSTAVSAGEYHSVALVGSSTGTVYTWGYNFYGQLGLAVNYATANPNKLAAPVPGLPFITAISAGYLHTLALDGGGRVWAWGYNALGQLGDGTLVTRFAPALVHFPTSTQIVAISAGGYHNLAIDTTGQLWSWGYNALGQLGNGSVLNSSIPVAIAAPPAIQVSAGGFHSLVLTTAGLIFACGDNANGQLGNGTNVNSNVMVLSSTAAYKAIAAGGFHSLAITPAGLVQGWGDNADGQLGNNSVVSSNVAVATLVLTNVTAISAGLFHSMAIASTSLGTTAVGLYAWGENANGQLGDNTLVNRHFPVPINPLTPPLHHISAGGFHSLIN